VPLDKAWGPATAESITGFAGVLGIAAWIALLLRAIVTRRFREREMFWVVVTPMILGIILGWPIVSTLFHLVFSIAANARLRLLLCLVLAVQSAAAIDLLFRERMHALYAGIAAVAAAMLFLYATQPFPSDAARDAALRSLLPSVIVLALAAIAVAARRFRTPAPVLPDTLMYPKTPMLAKLASVRHDQPFRVVGTGPVFFPNVGALFGVEDIRAHDPMANGRYLGTLRVIGNYETNDYFAKWNDFDTRLLDYLNVKYVLTHPFGTMKDPQRYALIYSGVDGQLFENRDVLPRFHPVDNVLLEFKGDMFMRRLVAHHDWANTAIVKRLPVESDQERTDLLAPRPGDPRRATSEIVRWTPTDYRLNVSAPRWTMIVSSQPWWPGWRITHGDRTLEALQVNGAFLGFVVPPGTAQVRVHYVPATFYGGLAISLLTLFAMIARGVMSRRRMATEDRRDVRDAERDHAEDRQ
jgi:hypothetical protein